MEELVQGLTFVVAVLDGLEIIAERVCKCPTYS